jgi:hypothetical protein
VKAGFANRADVTVISATATTENGELREILPKLRVAGREFQRITGVELRARIKFSMTLPRRICAESANALHPRTATLHLLREVSRVRTVDHVIRRR